MRKREPLDEDEKERLLEAAKDAELKRAFTVRVLTFAGLRAAELTHMTEDWVRWQDEQIRVPPHEPCDCNDCRQKAEDSDGRTIDDYWRPKTDAGVRTVPVRDMETWRLMREYFKRHESYDATRQTVGNRVGAVVEDAGIRKKCTPHVLRHTYGTMLARKEMTVQYIKQTMGHEDLSAASDYIQYVGRQLDKEADAKL